MHDLHQSFLRLQHPLIKLFSFVALGLFLNFRDGLASLFFFAIAVLLVCLIDNGDAGLVLCARNTWNIFERRFCIMGHSHRDLDGMAG